MSDFFDELREFWGDARRFVKAAAEWYEEDNKILPEPEPEPLIAGWYGQNMPIRPLMPTLPLTGPLPLGEIEAELEEAANDGAVVIFRPRYGSSGEDVDMPTLQSHIAAIGPVVSSWEDQVLVYHAGYVGRYGEFHGSSNFGADPDISVVREVVEGILASFPGWVGVRRPWWHRDLALERVTVFDDCIGCSASDGGSWPSAEEQFWREYIGTVVEGPVVGEMSQMSGTPAELKGFENTMRIMRLMRPVSVNAEWNPVVWADWTNAEFDAFTAELEAGFR